MTSTTKGSPVPASTRLRSTIAISSSRYWRACETFWGHARFAEVFPRHCDMLYPMVFGSLRAMDYALARATALAPTCPVAEALVPFLTRHIREESGHDEWVLESVAALGGDPDALRRAPPPPAVAALIGSQYYWVDVGHPVAIVGFFAVVEGTPSRVEEIDAARERSGLPRAAFETFYRHAVIDQRHGAEIYAMLDTLPLSTEHQMLLGLNAIGAVDQMAGLVERVCDLGPARSPVT